MSIGSLMVLPLALGLGVQSPSSGVMTPDEMSTLILQLAHCWAIPRLPKGTALPAVDIDVDVNADGTVLLAKVVDQARLAGDAGFRASAEPSLRAIHDPNCSPLALPPGKYEEWKSMTIHFDPKEVFGQ